MGNRGSYLVAGQSLAAGDYLSSPDGQYCAVLQDDGTSGYYRCADAAVFGFRCERPAHP